jgi:hypothetical protein
MDDAVAIGASVDMMLELEVHLSILQTVPATEDTEYTERKWNR